jgi:hypothetical protein
VSLIAEFRSSFIERLATSVLPAADASMISAIEAERTQQLYADTN